MEYNGRAGSSLRISHQVQQLSVSHILEQVMHNKQIIY